MTSKNGDETTVADEDFLAADDEGEELMEMSGDSVAKPIDAASATSETDTLEAIKQRVREMEEEAEKLKQLQTEVDRQMVGIGGVNLASMATNQAPGAAAAAGSTTPAAPGTLSLEEKMEVDARSVFVGNVDYGATAEEVEQHFHGCGSINRVTILCNKFDGHPKGFAYIEFSERESVQTAMAMDESLFRGRLIKVMPKRTNRPGMAEKLVMRGRGRGRILRGRGRGRGFLRGRGGGPMLRGGGAANRGAYFYSPY